MDSILAWIALLFLACRVQAAAVFAHFMVTNSANYTSDDWKNDMKLAQDAHIDAFALNMAYNDPTNIKALPAAFAAADSIGFKLFFSFDYAGNGDWPKTDVINLITQYSAHSSYFFYNGQAFVSTFEGPGRADDWPSIKAATGCFFIPSWSSLGAKPAVETGVVDGLFSWASWPWGSEDMNTYIDASYLQYLAGLPYMMPVSPWFFTNLPGYKKNWIWRGDHLWHDRWQEVLYVQPEFVEIISWNDYGESHYIGPLYDKAMEAFDIGEAPFNYVTDMPHDGWRATLPFWIDMYKTKTAEITEESIVAWYRLSPAAACASGGTSGNTASQLQIEFPPAEMVQDRIFFSAVLGSFSGAVVSIGGSSQTVGWSSVPDDDVGVFHGSVAFDGRTGPVTVSLLRDNKVIATIEGKEISASCPNGIQNWNAWVGSATVGTTVSARPKLLLSEQSCMNGTGANNFAGLCEFSCTISYRIAGEDASYSGLCNFDCNLGFCPPTACGTEQVPLATPSVSPFLPPACTAGTGEGNLAGLCDFSCTHGFCPMNACTCTGQGAVNVMNPTTDVVGEAAPGQDPAIYGPLCEYTCQRGYCPEGACAPKTESSGESGSGSGSASGSGDGDVYLAPSIWHDPSPVVQCYPPCSLIFPPLPLDEPTTIHLPPWTTKVPRSYVISNTSTGGDGQVTTHYGYETTTTNITVALPPIITGFIPMWGLYVNASVTTTTITMTTSLDLPLVVQVLPPYGPTPTSTTTTLTPPPYPWSQPTKDPVLNTVPTIWSSGKAKPTTSKGSKGAGHKCAAFCNGPCLGCAPDWSNAVNGGGGSSGGGGGGGGGGGSGSDSSDDEDCSTETAKICSTVCVAGSGCDWDCSTTTGCSVTATSTTTTDTPAPGFAVTMEQWPEITPQPDEDIRIAMSLEAELSSMFGPLDVISGPEATATATATGTGTASGSAPSNGADAGRVLISYYHDAHTGAGEWDLYQYYEHGPSPDMCPEVQTPNFVMTDGAFQGMRDGTGGFKAFGSTCTYKGTDLPASQSSGSNEAQVGTFVCDGFRDATCYTDLAVGTTCAEGWQSANEVLHCEW